MQLFRSADKEVFQGKTADLPFQMHRWIKDVDDDEIVTAVCYRAPVPIIRDRLELQGYTLELAKAVFTTSLQWEAKHYRQWAKRKHGELFQADAKILDSTDVDAWLAALHEIRRKGLRQQDLGGDSSAYKDTLIGYMLDHEWYGYSGPDLNVGLRLALEVCSDSDELVYDVTDLILSEYFTPEDDLVKYASELSSSEYSSKGKIIVLTEGRSDSWIISESLKLLHPHLSDYFNFMDFEGAKVGGGVGNLANVVKSFAGAGIVNKIVALFDNDTAAEAAIQGLRTVQIPRNIRVQKLPDLPALKHYPTIGPSGSVVMNVNGIAASVELYLGIDVLTDDTGNLTPVQWTGYDSGLRKYQGEVLFKEKIHTRFRRRLEACRADPRLVEKTDWGGLRSVLSSLFVAFHEIDGAELRRRIDEYFAR